MLYKIDHYRSFTIKKFEINKKVREIIVLKGFKTNLF